MNLLPGLIINILFCSNKKKSIVYSLFINFSSLQKGQIFAPYHSHKQLLGKPNEEAELIR